MVDFANAEGVERRPFPWLPAIPEKLAGDPEWRTYLGARFELVTRLAAEVRSEATKIETLPGWAGALIHQPSPEVITQIELWRAAHQIPDTDLRPTGPVQHRIVEAREQHRLDALVAGESEAVVTWLGLIHQAVPATVEDPATIRVARESAEADPDGSWLPEHVLHEARRALPDDHKADALRYRLEMWLRPVSEAVTTMQGRAHEPRHPHRSLPKPWHRHLGSPRPARPPVTNPKEGANAPSTRAPVGLGTRGSQGLCDQHLHPIATPRRG